MDLYNELQKLIAQLDFSIKELRGNGIALAKAERDYKVLLRQEVLKLRDDGTAVGVIDKICYGIPSIAEKRFERDCADSVYKANQEAINTLKLRIRILDSQLQREWSNEH